MLDRGRCTGSSPPTTAGSGSGAISSPIPPYAKPELLAERPNELWSWDVSKLQGPGEVDVLLPVRDPRRVQPFCGAPQNGCSVPGPVMWPAAAGANDGRGRTARWRRFRAHNAQSEVSQLRRDSSERQVGRVRGPTESSIGSLARSAAILAFVLIWA